MQMFSLIWLFSPLILVVIASPIGPKPPPPPPAATHPSINPGPAAQAGSNASPSNAAASGDIFQPLQLTNETLPHIGAEEESKPKKPHGLCVIA
ncbi:hypothetical protein C8R46DRAFT_1099499 [Mycena filopes]|nr:hypothetical protein C8R46DRAFT_1099499 [Mycena filopes]